MMMCTLINEKYGWEHFPSILFLKIELQKIRTYEEVILKGDTL